MNREQYNQALKDLLLWLGVFVITLFGVAAYTLLALAAVDTSEWFAETPTSNAPTLEVKHGGDGTTLNTQKTVDAAELQGSEL